MFQLVDLVGGLEHEFYDFPYLSIYWENHDPNWQTHIFQRGRYTTNQWLSFVSFPHSFRVSITGRPWEFRQAGPSCQAAEAEPTPKSGRSGSRRGSVVVPIFSILSARPRFKTSYGIPNENIWNSLKMKKCHGFKAHFLDVSCDNLNFGGNYLRCWLDLSRYIIRECADHFPRLPGKWHETILAICYPHPKSCTITYTISSTISLHQLSWAVF